MARLPILQEPSPLLRKRAKEVPFREIASPLIQKLIRDMTETLRHTELGIGIAAPQVGRLLRIFLISEEALRKKPQKENPLQGEAEKKDSGEQKQFSYLVFINPEMKKSSKKKNILTEGCLSVNNPRGDLIYGKIARSEKVAVQAYDETGKKFTRGASRLLAQVIQHEMDHLDGILFIDKAEDLVLRKQERKPPPLASRT